ncbi:MAG TPA: NAD(P)H-dependent glycerol-3-phosphate dehydrogenase [Spirochaetota bacterium]|nr:NAD(P)H-dependent glycerol-3-phosphate dehydrogenase [Spirochaetota bacterium]
MFFKKQKDKIAILGSGSFGSALSIVLAEKFDVILWGINPEIINEINTKKTNNFYLEDARFPENVFATLNIENIRNCDTIVFAVPSSATREVATKAKPFINKKAIVVSAAKGLEETTGYRMSQVLNSILPNPVVVISGPSHAEELAAGIPTSVVAASRSNKYALKIQKEFSSKVLRVYSSKDVIGVELGGVLKNIIAIAAGINSGLGLGVNSQAALITRGLVEIVRFGISMKAKKETFLGLSGIGDLIVTATSSLSRNWTLGYKIGQGKTLEEALAEMKMVCEGVKTTQVVYPIALKNKIDMPITEQIYKVLFERKNPKEAVKDLMTRSLKEEKII